MSSEFSEIVLFLFFNILLFKCKSVSSKKILAEKCEIVSENNKTSCDKYQNLKERYRALQKILDELKLQCQEGYHVFSQDIFEDDIFKNSFKSNKACTIQQSNRISKRLEYIKALIRKISDVCYKNNKILPTVSAPTLLYQPKVQEIVTLDCTVQASGQLFTVTWYYNNGVLATNTGRYSDGNFGTPSLTISNLQTSDSGSYICSAATATGSRNSSAIVVTVQQNNLTLNCNVDAFGQPVTVRWYYNNAILSILRRYSGGSSGSPSLSISGLQMSDSGSYICSAATTEGSRNGSAISVNVQEILPVVTVSKNFYQANGGESVTLNCSVNAAELAYTVRWYYNGAILSPNTGRYSGGSFGNPSFTISSPQISDSGSYICSASTAAGSRNSSVISLAVQQYIRSIIICERTHNTITCDKGTISIITATYGRSTGLEVCPGDIFTTSCKSENSLAVVNKKCNKQVSCTLFASNSDFGDPCIGTYKYLDITYECIN